VARQEVGAGSGEGGRRAVFPLRNLAHGEPEQNRRPDALPASGTLFASDDSPAVLAVPVDVQTRRSSRSRTNGNSASSANTPKEPTGREGLNRQDAKFAKTRRREFAVFSARSRDY
jgi:hypothetical protein